MAAKLRLPQQIVDNFTFTYTAVPLPAGLALLLGVVANRFPGEAFTWDAENMRTDSDNANALLRREYREGFEVENLQAMVAG